MFSIAMHSFEARANRLRDRADMTYDALAVILAWHVPGINRSNLNAALTGNGRPLSNELALKCEPVLRELSALLDATKPLPIDWRKPTSICLVLQMIREGQLQISVVCSESEVNPEGSPTMDSSASPSLTRGDEHEGSTRS